MLYSLFLEKIERKKQTKKSFEIINFKLTLIRSKKKEKGKLVCVRKTNYSRYLSKPIQDYLVRRKIDLVFATALHFVMSKHFEVKIYIDIFNFWFVYF